MKNNIYLLAVLAMLIFSCKEESEEIVKADEAPNGTIQVANDRDTLWNEVNITVDASDPDGEVMTVDFYVNDLWIGSDAEAPYEFTWNTKDVEDGAVTLKATVTDDQDKTWDFIEETYVMNTLIEYDIRAGYFNMSPNYKYFTYITDATKKVLYFDQIETTPYKATAVRPDDFDDASFSVHFVRANGSNGHLDTYTQISPGVFAPVNDDMKGAKTGSATVKFKDIPQHDLFYFSKSSGDELKPDVQYKQALYENLSLGYLYLRKGKEGIYKMINDIKDGAQDVSLKATGFEMDLHEVAIKEKLTGFNIKVFGHTGPEVDAPSLRVFSKFKFGEMAGYGVFFHTPKSTGYFDHYSTFLSFSHGDVGYINESYFGVIDTPKKLDIGFTAKSKKLSDIDLAVVGNGYDVLKSTYYVNADEFFFTWNNYSENEHFEFPIIPTELTKALPKFTNSSIVFKEADVLLKVEDYDHLDSYNGYLERVFGRNGITLKEGGSQCNAVFQSF